MSNRQLWYVRRGGKVSGPFPTQVVANNALLGRFMPDDEVSLDQREWRPLVAVEDLLPPELLELHHASDPEQRQWLEERLKAARRWADQRTHDDRRQEREAWDEELRSDERRKNLADNDVLALPHHHAEAARESNFRRYFGPVLGMGVLVLLVILGLFYYQPVNPVKVGVLPAQPQCHQAATQGINWSGCDKREIRLRGADLSRGDLGYADFSLADLSGSRMRQARLVGANFRGADLDHADLSGTDLSYADLGGASLVSTNLAGAVLDHAIWADGRECAAGSLGQCR